MRPQWLVVLIALLAAACGEPGGRPYPDERPREEARQGGREDSAGVPVGDEPVRPPAASGGEVRDPAPTAGQEPTGVEGSAQAVPGPEEEEEADGTPRFRRPDHVRGIYLNAWTAGSRSRRERLLGLARRTEVNTFVIDIKDASGFVSHETRLPLALEVGATEEIRIRDLPGLLRQLAREQVYPIARIVVAKDPILSLERPDLAIQDSAGGVWVDQKGSLWLTFFHREVWDYHVDLAREVARAGFPEIQWDYVRFPDAPDTVLARARFPGRDGRTRVEAVRAFLGYARDALREEGVAMTADVFGVTTSYRRDVGIGQLWEAFIDRVDVALPMVYPSHYWTGSFGYENPNAHPYEIVRRALRDARARSAAVEGAGTTRPWLQDFSLGDPPYGAPEVRAQIQATYDAGIHEWLLWNPGSRYTEEALIPARGLPSWLEPVMRVGGMVVPVSQRLAVLGEEARGVPAEGSQNPVLPDPSPVLVRPGPGRQLPPPVPPPDTTRVSSGGGQGSEL